MSAQAKATAVVEPTKTEGEEIEEQSTDPRVDVSEVIEAPDQQPEPEVTRVIVQDPLGRVVAVPEDQIPEGSIIIGPDAIPGTAAAQAETTVSEPVNPAPEPVAAPDVTVNPQTGTPAAGATSTPPTPGAPGVGMEETS